MNTPTPPSIPDVLVVGAGPSGLATAIAAKQHGLEYAIIEKGVLVGLLLTTPGCSRSRSASGDAVREAHTPRVAALLPTRRRHLWHSGVVPPRGDRYCPTGRRICRSDDREVPPGSRRANGSEDRASWRARAVVLAIGYYDIPNTLGVPGEQLPHVSHYYKEPHPYTASAS